MFNGAFAGSLLTLGTETRASVDAASKFIPYFEEEASVEGFVDSLYGDAVVEVMLKARVDDWMVGIRVIELVAPVEEDAIAVKEDCKREE